MGIAVGPISSVWLLPTILDPVQIQPFPPWLPIMQDFSYPGSLYHMDHLVLLRDSPTLYTFDGIIHKNLITFK